jgi:hypothetical protein
MVDALRAAVDNTASLAYGRLSTAAILHLIFGFWYLTLSPASVLAEMIDF